MFLRYYKLVLAALAVLLLAFVGWKWVYPGLTYKPPMSTSTVQAILPPVDNSPSNPTKTPTSTTPTAADYRAALQEAVKNFQATKSFRAKVTVSATEGDINAVLEFAKPSRFRGTIQASDNTTAQIIVVDNSLFMQVNNQPWLDLTNTPSAKTIGDTLKNALNGDSNLDDIGLDGSVPITESRDTANNCDSYQTSVKTASSTSNAVTLCIADGLPKYMNLQTSNGPIHLDYYDYNTVFIIAKPIP